MCGLFWGAHKSLAPRARTLLGGLGQATLSFFAVATLLFVFFGECPKFCDLAKQRRKIVGGVSEVGKDDFSLYFFWRCVIFLVFYFSSAAIARQSYACSWNSNHYKQVLVSVLLVLTQQGPLKAGFKRKLSELIPQRSVLEEQREADTLRNVRRRLENMQ